MSKFEVKIVYVNGIEAIEGADAIELAVIGDYRSVVKKNTIAVGDPVVYIPESSIVPEWLLAELNLVGKLAGKDKNRVKPIRLLGQLSQGLVYKCEWDRDDVRRSPVRLTIPHKSNDGMIFYESQFFPVGDDVAEFLGITKYEPPIPTHMSGDVYNAGQELTVKYDIENIKKWPDILHENEEDVVITEKIHGTFCGITVLPPCDWNEKHYRSKFVVFSKGLGAEGIAFKQNEVNINNLYIRTLEKSGIFDKLESKINNEWRLAHNIFTPICFLGEVFGVGVQDLTYGIQIPQFRLFDICIGYRYDQKYLNYDKFSIMSEELEINTVPVLYTGVFSKQKMLELTSGNETVSGQSKNIREGVVIKPVIERVESDIGRVIFKSVSEQYLLRKGNVTEFQ